MDFIIVFSFIIFMVLVPFASMGVHWLGARAGELIQARVDNERLRTILLRLDDAVVTAVKDLGQTLVGELRARTKDGKLSREDRRHLKETAVRHVKTYLGSTGLKELGRVLGLWELSVDDLIKSKVEATVHDLKRAATPPSPDTSDDSPS